MADIFLSYAEQDRPAAHGLAELLEQVGWTVWWDQRIPAGSAWRSAIAAAIGSTRCLVVLWSRDSVASPWVNEEAEQARRAGKLIPILIDDIEPPLGFGELQCADLTRWDGRADAPTFRQLLRDIEAVAGTPRTKSPEDVCRERIHDGDVNEAGARRDGASLPSPPPDPRRRPRMLLLAGLALLAVTGGAIAAAWTLWPTADGERPTAIAPGVSAPAHAPVAQPPGGPSPLPDGAVGSAEPTPPRPEHPRPEPPRPEPSRPEPSPPQPAALPAPTNAAVPSGEAPRKTRQDPTAEVRSDRSTPQSPARCGALLGRLQLGETLSDADRAYLQQECRR